MLYQSIDDRYIKTKIRTYGDKVYTNFVPKDDIKCKSLTVISTDSLLIYKNKYDLQVYLDNCAYKFIGKQIIDYLGKNTFEADEN